MCRSGFEVWKDCVKKGLLNGKIKRKRMEVGRVDEVRNLLIRGIIKMNGNEGTVAAEVEMGEDGILGKVKTGN